MAIRNIRIMGDPILEKVCKEVKEVTPRTQELIDDMLETNTYINSILHKPPGYFTIFICFSTST